MATITISLPDAMKEWVEAQAATGRFGNISDVVLDLIRREQIRSEKIAAMNRMVEEGLASGISDRTVEDVLEEARRKALARASGASV